MVVIIDAPVCICEEGAWEKGRVCTYEAEHTKCDCFGVHFHLLDHTKHDCFGVRFYFNRNECIYTHRNKNVQNYELLNMIRAHFQHLEDGDLVW